MCFGIAKRAEVISCKKSCADHLPEAVDLPIHVQSGHFSPYCLPDAECGAASMVEPLETGIVDDRQERNPIWRFLYLEDD